MDADLLDKLRTLGPKRRELLSRILQARSGAAGPPLRRRERDAALPLSFAQRRLWLAEQIDPGSSRHNVPEAIRLRGPLDIAALGESINTLVMRHEVLRTRFRVEGGEPRQEIAPALAVPLTVAAPGGGWPGAAAAAVLEARRPFDVAELPLVRAWLARIGDDDHLFMLTFHHIVYDGWSRNVLVEELSQLYLARSLGQADPLPEPALQYGDFALWQREVLAGPEIERHLAYWRGALAGAPETTELPADRRPPRRPSFAGGQRTVPVPAPVRRELARLCQDEGATLFMLGLAAFATLLHRTSGQEDIVLGAPVANRTRPELERMIGFFVNTLPLRLTLAPERSFRQLLQQARGVVSTAMAHQEMPLERLVEELRPERAPGVNPLFQATVAVRGSVPAPRLGALEATPLDLDWGLAVFDLGLTLVEEGENLHVHLVYGRERFDDATAERLTAQMVELLRGVAADPDCAVGRLPLMSEPERQARLTPPRQRLPAVDERPLHRVFEARAAHAPDAPAVTFEGETLSYAEANRRANRIAHTLRALGVQRGARVALHLPRSLDLPLAILGTMKAGAAYVALDPTHPDERLRAVLEDAGAAAVLTTSALAGRGLGPRAATVTLDQSAQLDERADDPAAGAGPDDLAYVIFTSGSTGRPKGVGVTHRNVQGLFAGAQARHGFAADDVWTLFHTCAFDFSVWEIWGAFLYGGRLVVVPQEVTRTYDALLALLCRERVTVLNQTPGSFQQLVAIEASRQEPAPLALRQVFLGGESLDVGILRPFMARHGDERPRIYNLYGITETTIATTSRRITAADLGREPASLIGEPLPGQHIYLLDAEQEPVPTGARGEITIGGVGVTPGYLNRPELERARFIAHPLTGERLYRSGDLARRRSDGELEYLGRSDDQVKVRGVRIELGEIEAVLARHPAVAHAAVLVRDHGDKEQRLVGFVVPRKTSPAPDGLVEALRAWAGERLPAVMVPPAILELPELPLNRNGKLDRRALEALAATARPRRGLAPSRNADEAALARIWCEVLEIDAVGIHDDFFAVGGHSLLGVELMHRVQQHWGRTLPLATLFEASTVARMAALLRTPGDAEVGAGLVVPIRARPRGRPLVLVHPAGGQVLAYQQLAAALSDEQGIWGVQSRALGGGSERDDLDGMCRDYADAVIAAKLPAPPLLAGWSLGGVLAMSVAAALRARGVPLAGVALMDSYLQPGVSHADERAEGDLELLTDLAGVLGASASPALWSIDAAARAELAAALRGRTPRQQLDGAVDWARARGLLEPGASPPLVEDALALMARHRRLLRGYCPPVLDVPLWVFWAREALDGVGGRLTRPDWAKFSTHPVAQHVGSGNHFSMLRAPNVLEIAKRLQAQLNAEAP